MADATDSGWVYNPTSGGGGGDAGGYGPPVWVNVFTGEQRSADPVMGGDQAPQTNYDISNLPNQTVANFEGTPTQFADAQGNLQAILTRGGIEPISKYNVIATPGQPVTVNTPIQAVNSENQLLFVNPSDPSNPTTANTGIPYASGTLADKVMLNQPAPSGGVIDAKFINAVEIAGMLAVTGGAGASLLDAIGVGSGALVGETGMTAAQLSSLSGEMGANAAAGANTLGGVAGLLQTAGVSTETAAAIAPYVSGAGKGALTSALSGGNPLTGALTGGIAGGLSPYISSALVDNADLSKGTADIISKGTTGAASGAVSGLMSGTDVGTGAAKGGLISAGTEVFGQLIGGAPADKQGGGEGIPPDVNAVAQGAADGKYQLDEFGNIKYDENGKPIPVEVDPDAIKTSKELTSLAKSLASPLISQEVSKLFGTSAPSSTSASSSGTAQSTQLPSYLASTAPSASYGGATYSGPASTQGQPGSQALAQALRVGDPSNAGTSVESPSEGTGANQNVWNTASLRVKDETGSQV